MQPQPQTVLTAAVGLRPDVIAMVAEWEDSTTTPKVRPPYSEWLVPQGAHGERLAAIVAHAQRYNELNEHFEASVRFVASQPAARAWRASLGER